MDYKHFFDTYGDGTVRLRFADLPATSPVKASPVRVSLNMICNMYAARIKAEFEARGSVDDVYVPGIILGLREKKALRKEGLTHRTNLA